MKRIIAGLCAITVCILAGCGNKSQGELDSVSSVKNQLKKELSTSYGDEFKNLNFKCKKINFPDADKLQVIELKRDYLSEEEPSKENVSNLIKKAEDILGNSIDLNQVSLSDPVGDTSMSYNDGIENLNSYKRCPYIYYKNLDSRQSLEMIRGNIHICKGKIAAYLEEFGNVFSCTDSLEQVKDYGYETHDSNEKVKLLDGEITLADASKVMEKYLDDISLDGGKNIVKNTVTEISVDKISGTDVNVVHGYRTFSFDGIPFRAIRNNSSGEISSDELACIGEVFMVETTGVDVVLGMANDYVEYNKKKEIKEIIPLKTALAKVSDYLTGGTKFDILSAGLEYRLFKQDGDGFKCDAVPYWCFVAENQRDLSRIRIYVDIQTGETAGFNE